MTDSPWAPVPVSEPVAPVTPPEVVVPTAPAPDAWTPEPVAPAAISTEDEPEGGWIAYQDGQGWHRVPRKDYKG